MKPEQIAADAESAARLHGESDAMVDRHERVAYHQKWYDRLKLTLLTLVSILVAVILVITVVTLQELRDNSAENRRNTNLLVECTTPGNACYDRSTRQSGEAVAVINRIAVYAAYCAKSLPTTVTVQQVEKCVRTELEKPKP